MTGQEKVLIQRASDAIAFALRLVSEQPALTSWQASLRWRLRDAREAIDGALLLTDLERVGVPSHVYKVPMVGSGCVLCGQTADQHMAWALERMTTKDSL